MTICFFILSATSHADVMSPPLTVQGGDFTVGSSSLIVSGGNVGIATATFLTGGIFHVAAPANTHTYYDFDRISPTYDSAVSWASNAYRYWYLGFLPSAGAGSSDLTIYNTAANRAIAVFEDSTGNVGLSTTTFMAGGLFHIAAPPNTNTYYDFDRITPSNDSAISWATNASRRWYMGFLPASGSADGDLTIYNAAAGRAIETFQDSTGNVGIGTSSPATLLHLSSGTLTIDGSPAALNVAGGSVTASAFFGDGTHLAGLSVLTATQTFSGSNTFYSSSTFASGGRDIILSTAASANVGALKVVGNTGAIQISTAVVFLGIKAPISAANQGILYYDSTNNAFYVSENGGTPKPIVDPPGNWTCTIRTGSGASMYVNNSPKTDSVSCSGNEKAISGGCTWSSLTISGGSATGQIAFGNPTGQGWSCIGFNSYSLNLTMTAYVNCCQ